MVKYTITVTMILSAVFSTSLWAEPSSKVAFDGATRAIITSGNAAMGKALTEKYKCNKCHGDMGVSEDEDPNTAGQIAAYNFKQMMDYKSGHRDERTMAKKIKKVSTEEMAHIAAWYASLPRPASSDKETSEAIKTLVLKGDKKRSLKPCASCHGFSGQGGDNDAAAIVGENREYFIATLTEFKEEERANDIYSRMRIVAQALTEEEIAGLADFYAAPMSE